LPRSSLCPPHLVEQWTGELKLKFDLECPVTAASASRLERDLPASQTLFDAYPHTVVSLDYIKAYRRRDSFARAKLDQALCTERENLAGDAHGVLVSLGLSSSEADRAGHWQPRQRLPAAAHADESGAAVNPATCVVFGNSLLTVICDGHAGIKS
jgi:hypothetical protein